MKVMEEIAKTIRIEDNATLHVLKTYGTYTPYVVCWNYNGETWNWGTYCRTLDEAFEIYTQKQFNHGFIFNCDIGILKNQCN